VEKSPNEELTPYFEGDELIWITLPEYYNRVFGHFALKEAEDGEA